VALSSALPVCPLISSSVALAASLEAAAASSSMMSVSLCRGCRQNLQTPAVLYGLAEEASR